jgi:hypothetical protein
MFEILLITVIIEEALCGVWICERERVLLQALTERMVRYTRELQERSDAGLSSAL